MIQRLPARLYARFGPRVVFGWYVLAFAAGAATLSGTSIWAGRYLHLPASKLWAAAGLAIAWLAVLLPVIWAPLVASPVRRILSWSEQDRSPAKAAEVWNAVNDVFNRVPLFVPLAAVAGVPIVATVDLVTHISVASAAGQYLAGMVGTCAGVVPLLFGFELLMRPMLGELASYLPPDFDPTARAVPLRTKALAAISSVAVVAALTVGAFDTIVASGPLRMVIAVGIALASVALAGGIFWLVMRSLLQPIYELLAATRRVGEGDIETPVPVVTGDELGSLTAGFNRMLADLRRHEEELRESRARIVAAADDARRRVERDLHDGAQQDLVLLGLKLGATRRLVGRDSPADRSLLELEQDLGRALAGLRDLAHGLYPQLLESDGLPAALTEAVQRAAIPTHIDCDGAGRYPPEVEAAVYFCCLEALQNAGKHSGDGATAQLRLRQLDGRLLFEVSDDGAGFDADRDRAGAGLQNMIDRIGALGGTLDVRSEPGAGTTIIGAVPV